MSISPFTLFLTVVALTMYEGSIARNYVKYDCAPLDVFCLSFLRPFFLKVRRIAKLLACLRR